MNLVAYRVLAMVEAAALSANAAVDAITSDFPQLFNGTVPFILIVTASAATFVGSFHYLETQG
jgi:hypothetical protein